MVFSYCKGSYCDILLDARTFFSFFSTHSQFSFSSQCFAVMSKRMGYGSGNTNEESIEAVEVQCYVQQSHRVAATGSVAAGPMDEIKGLSQPAAVTWNPLKLPGTILIIIMLLWRFWVLHYREDDDDDEASDIFSTRRSSSTRNLHFVSTIIRENALIPSRLQFPYPEFYRLLSSPISHSSVVSLAFSVLGIYWMGATNEIDFGTIPFSV